MGIENNILCLKLNLFFDVIVSQEDKPQLLRFHLACIYSTRSHCWGRGVQKVIVGFIQDGLTAFLWASLFSLCIH